MEQRGKFRDGESCVKTIAHEHSQGYMDGCMDGWTIGRLGGWMDGRKNR